MPAKKPKMRRKTYVYFVTGPEGRLRPFSLSVWATGSRTKAVDVLKKPWPELYKRGFRATKASIEWTV